MPVVSRSTIRKNTTSSLSSDSSATPHRHHGNSMPKRRKRHKSTLFIRKLYVIIFAFLVVIFVFYHGINSIVYIEQTTPANSANSNDIAERDAEPAIACVKKVGSQCRLYPCEEQKKDGTAQVERTANNTFGYVGKFVRREFNGTTKYHALPGNDGIPQNDHQPPDETSSEETIKGRGRPPHKKARWDSGCAISDEYKFVYIHVLKSGGSAIKTFIRKSLCGEEDEKCEHTSEQIIKPIRCREAIRDYPHYFFFSFARNPFSRMYSMYSMMDGFPIAINPNSRNYNKTEAQKRVTDGYTFHDFALSPVAERKRHTSMSPSHYVSQSKILFRDDCPIFDYLGRLEHFDEDMQTILNHLNVSEMLNYFEKSGGKVQPVNTWGATKKASPGGDLRSAYVSKEIVELVANNYKEDFALLGYSPNQIPMN